jgi:ribosomal protein S18 acetylase RimI-like enzyme
MQCSIIRKVNISDLNLLLELANRTFEETFSDGNDPIELEKYLNSRFTKEVFLKEFNNPNSFFFFIELYNMICGYLKLNINEAQTENCLVNALEIERIYISSAFQGKKLGYYLYQKALEVAKAKNKKSIWLGAWEKNTQAIQFYEKNGFTKFDKHVFQFGNEKQTDIMMKIEHD